MYSRILVPIDTTHENDDGVKAQLTTACKIAERPDGLIHIMSVIPRNLLEGYYPDLYTDKVAEEVRTKLEAIVKSNCPPDAQIEISVEEGGIYNNILGVARELPADAIVIASHDPSLRNYFLGSSAGYIALHAPCSVFVVRESQTATSGRFLKYTPAQRELHTSA
jgi:nucleotide-binding universal stress UspA family protein